MISKTSNVCIYECFLYFTENNSFYLFSILNIFGSKFKQYINTNGYLCHLKGKEKKIESEGGKIKVAGQRSHKSVDTKRMFLIID